MTATLAPGVEVAAAAAWAAGGEAEKTAAAKAVGEAKAAATGTLAESEMVDETAAEMLAVVNRLLAEPETTGAHGAKGADRHPDPRMILGGRRKVVIKVTNDIITPENIIIKPKGKV
jgi:hypothetical protein